MLKAVGWLRPQLSSPTTTDASLLRGCLVAVLSSLQFFCKSTYYLDIDEHLSVLSTVLLFLFHSVFISVFVTVYVFLVFSGPRLMFKMNERINKLIILRWLVSANASE